MDLQDLKNVWDEEITDVIPTISLEQRKKLNLPLENIRKNMKREFYSNIALYIFVIIFFVCAEFPTLRLKMYMITLFFAMALITAFYFITFFKLYNTLTKVDFTILENLKDLQYELKLNEQYYYAYNVAIIPFLIAEMLVYADYIPTFENMSDFNLFLLIIICCLLFSIVIYFTARVRFKLYYGKYKSKISSLINEIK